MPLQREALQLLCRDCLLVEKLENLWQWLPGRLKESRLLSAALMAIQVRWTGQVQQEAEVALAPACGLEVVVWT